MNLEIIMYQTEDGLTKIESTFDSETVWLSIDQMAELFGRDKSVIGKHIRNIFKERELVKDSVWANFAYTASDGKIYQVDLDLVEFFHSVDPNFIYNFILEKVSPLYTDDEKKDFEKILKQLLYFRVSNLKTQEEDEEYLKPLHNQEHSVELIKSSVNICKTFDFLQMKSMDYYVLFLACYLHDISMILQPSSDRFLESNAQTDEIYSSFLKFKSEIFTDTDIDEFHFENKSNVKLVMKKSFEQLNL